MSMSTRRLEALAVDGRDHDLIQYFAMCGVWALSMYTACDIRCSYCVTYAQGPSEPRVPADEVASTLRRALEVVPPEGVIGVGALVDAYPTVEATAGLTRRALTVLRDEQRPTVIVTKGTTVTRDIDILAAMASVTVQVSLCTTDDDRLRRLEPNAPASGERLAAVRELAAAGIDVRLLVQPWIPDLTDVAAITDAAGDVPLWVAPLSVDTPAVSATALGRRFTQAEINERYLEERNRSTPRAGTIWQEPLWLTEHQAAPWAVPALPAGTVQARNVAVVHRLLDGLHAGTGLQVWFETWSPHVRGHDIRSVSSWPGYERSGYFRDVLFESAGALDDPRYEVLAIEASDDEVHARIQVSGRHMRPLLGRPPSGEVIGFITDHTFRFDGLGLAIDITQDVDLTSLDLRTAGSLRPDG